MSGKPAKTGWGGARQGSGRKKRFSLSEQQMHDMLRAAKKEAKAQGRSLDQVLIGWAYNEDPKVSLGAIRIFKDFTMHKVTEQNVSVTEHRAPVALPESRPDPAKVISLVAKEQAD